MSSILGGLLFITGVMSSNSSVEWRKLVPVEEVQDYLNISTILDLRDGLSAVAVSL